MVDLPSSFQNIDPENDFVLFLGYDPLEDLPYQVAKYSAEQTFPGVKVIPLKTKELRQHNLFWRPTLIEGNTGEYIDILENRPHSLDYSFTRFLVPFLARSLKLKHSCMYADSSTLFLGDFKELFLEMDRKKDSPCGVVKHSFPTYVHKKRNQFKQLKYDRKLWSSVMVFNHWHKDCLILDKECVSEEEGLYLHTLRWVGESSSIVSFPERFNFVIGHSERNEVNTPKIINFTEASPWFKGDNRLDGNLVYSKLWLENAQKALDHLANNLQDVV
jgi:hypothetical protein